MTTDDEAGHPAPDTAGHAALAAAGEAAAFFAGAPIAGAADAAVGLGDVVAGRDTPDVPARQGLAWGWLLLGALVVLAALAWALKG